MARARANVAWMEDARTALNADPAFRRLGSTDLRLGLVFGGVARLVSFEAFQITAVTEADPADMRDADLVLEMAARDWNTYLRQRGRGRAVSLLALDLERPVISARTPLKRLLFERYNRSVQAFIDRGAALAA